jgi:hypothetical protein
MRIDSLSLDFLATPLLASCPVPPLPGSSFMNDSKTPGRWCCDGTSRTGAPPCRRPRGWSAWSRTATSTTSSLAMTRFGPSTSWVSDRPAAPARTRRLSPRNNPGLHLRYAGSGRLWRRLKIETTARQLDNFFRAATEPMQVMARACGHDHLNRFCIDDLTTWDRKIKLTGSKAPMGFQ